MHWAAGSGHEKCVKLLLDHYDALASALSSLDGNNNNNAKKAATMGGSGGDGNTDGDVEKKKKKSIVHEFDFLRGDGAGLEGQVDDDDGDDDNSRVGE